MYLTAHRVWSRTLNREGVHAFRYRHLEPLKTPVDVVRVANHEPGELEASIIELPAGGNEVRSYLDIVAVNDLSEGELAATISRLLDAVRTTDAPFTYSQFDDVASRFYAKPTLIPSRVDEILALGSALRRLYERPLPKLPLVVHVESGEQSIRLTLDPDSGQRIRELLGPDWKTPPSITIERDPLKDFEAKEGSIFQHSIFPDLLPVLTGLDAPQIEALGGVRVMTKTGREIVIPANARKTIHVVGDRGFHDVSEGHGNTRSGNIYDVLFDDTTKISSMLGAILIEKEEEGHYNIEWNGFPKKP
jgi:hypothetical protein